MDLNTQRPTGYISTNHWTRCTFDGTIWVQILLISYQQSPHMYSFDSMIKVFVVPQTQLAFGQAGFEHGHPTTDR